LTVANKNPPNIIPLLATIPYFQGVDPETLQTIAQSAFFKEYAPGQVIFLEGEQTAGLYIVQDGWLKVSKMALDGREQILQLLGSGEVFNAVSVFTDQANPASVTALEPSKIWSIRRETLLTLLDTHPQFARYVIRDLAGRVLHLISLVEDLSLRTVEARLAKLLLEKSLGGVIPRQRWATQNEIASRLGTVPDVVSRTMRRFSDRGLIQIDRLEIRIMQRVELEEIAMLPT
jgi:CRP/FNR family transcriptional regulator